MKKIKTVLKQHGLSIALITLILVQGVDYFFVGYGNWSDKQAIYSELLGRELPSGYGDYLDEYRAEMQVSLVADTYGALLLVLLTKKLYEKGSAESN